MVSTIKILILETLNRQVVWKTICFRKFLVLPFYSRLSTTSTKTRFTDINQPARYFNCFRWRNYKGEVIGCRIIPSPRALFLTTIICCFLIELWKILVSFPKKVTPFLPTSLMTNLVSVRCQSRLVDAIIVWKMNWQGTLKSVNRR